MSAKKHKEKVLSTLLAASMTVSLVSGPALAAEEGTPVEGEGPHTPVLWETNGSDRTPDGSMDDTSAETDAGTEHGKTDGEKGGYIPGPEFDQGFSVMPPDAGGAPQDEGGEPGDGPVDGGTDAGDTNPDETDPDQDAADQVMEVIEALPSVEELSLEDQEAVEAARAAYDGLTEEQKALVSAACLETLSNAEAKIEELQEAGKEYNFDGETHRWATEPFVDTKPTTEGIEVNVEYISERDMTATITYTIPKGFEKKDIHINAVRDMASALGENEYVPGDGVSIQIRILNHSDIPYQYKEDSFYVTSSKAMEYSEDDPGYNYNRGQIQAGWIRDAGTGTPAIGYDGNYLGGYSNGTGDGPCRVSNPALEELCDKNGLREADMTDSVLDQKLQERGYAGIGELNKYYLDFYNELFETSCSSLEEFSDAQISRIFSGTKYSKLKETNEEVAELGYNWFYNEMLVVEPTGTASSDRGLYTIGAWMRGENNYEEICREELKGIETGSEVVLPTLESMYIPRYVGNWAADMNFGWSLGLDLEATITTYTVNHEYYTSTDGGAYVLDGTVHGDAVEGTVGDVVTLDGLTQKPDYEGNTYTYKSMTPAEGLTLGSDAESNVITLRYERNVTTSGGGGDDDDDDRPIPTPTPEPTDPGTDILEPSIPLDPAPEPDPEPSPEPEVEVPEEETPLAPAPEEPETEIPDEETPKGSLPQTGMTTAAEPAMTMGMAAAAASLVAAGLHLTFTRKKNEEE